MSLRDEVAKVTCQGCANGFAIHQGGIHGTEVGSGMRLHVFYTDEDDTPYYEPCTSKADAIVTLIASACSAERAWWVKLREIPREFDHTMGHHSDDSSDRRPCYCKYELQMEEIIREHVASSPTIALDERLREARLAALDEVAENLEGIEVDFHFGKWLNDKRSSLRG